MGRDRWKNKLPGPVVPVVPASRTGKPPVVSANALGVVLGFAAFVGVLLSLAIIMRMMRAALVSAFDTMTMVALCRLRDGCERLADRVDRDRTAVDRCPAVVRAGV